MVFTRTNADDIDYVRNAIDSVFSDHISFKSVRTNDDEKKPRYYTVIIRGLSKSVVPHIDKYITSLGDMLRSRNLKIVNQAMNNTAHEKAYMRFDVDEA